MTNATNSARRPAALKYSLWEWTRGYLVLAATLPLFPVMWLLNRRKLPAWLLRKLLQRHRGYTASRPMDFRIPPDTAIPAYMERWWYLPRNWGVNCYFHIFRRSDDDRAHHDHPWWSFSLVLEGGYYEHECREGGVVTRTWCEPGTMRFRWHGKLAHRVELQRWDGPSKYPGMVVNGEVSARTIFITGPVLRRWGFHDGLRGWVDAYDWDDHCERFGLKAMRMDGGSDAVISERNHHKG